MQINLMPLPLHIKTFLREYTVDVDDCLGLIYDFLFFGLLYKTHFLSIIISQKLIKGIELICIPSKYSGV